MNKKRIAILGSTGSIGKQALEVVDAHPYQFSVEVITAYNNSQLLIEQAIKYKPNIVVIGNEDKYNEVANELFNHDIKVFAGEKSIQQVVAMDNIDMVLAAMVGFSGLLPVIEAIKAKKTVALANKETLVVAGEIINQLCRENNVPILPVDSEHSAIFQCLTGEGNNPIEKIHLTCSGGPFRNHTYDQLQKVTLADALDHPNWNMGSKITIDSATLMNKGFEAIEAKWLFDLKPEQIDVVIHPQSIVHSMVQFEDGSIKAQLGLPDMRLPIQYAMSYPDRFKNHFPRFNFTDYPELTFSAPNTKKFRNLALAFQAMQKGGNLACIVNAANEIVVQGFLNKQIKFLEMPEAIEQIMDKIHFIKHPSLNDYLETDRETRVKTKELILKK